MIIKDNIPEDRVLQQIYAFCPCYDPDGTFESSDLYHDKLSSLQTAPEHNGTPWNKDAAGTAVLERSSAVPSHQPCSSEP